MGRLERRRDGTTVVLSAEHVVGRLPLCHLSLDASFISTAHALFRWNGEFWEVRDLGSMNGTYVNEQRITIGAPARVKPGAEIMFGGVSERWRLIDDRPPTPAAVPVDGGPPSYIVSGTIPIPSADEPLATIYAEGQGWSLEIDDLRKPIEPGHHFSVGGRSWRFDCPSGAAETRATETRRKKLDEVTLAFTVSRNEEHVKLTVRSGHLEQDLGERGCFYLALVLVERRLKEHGLGENEPGWLDMDELLKMVPEYASSSHINVEICRLRQVLHDAGIDDAPRMIERRRGQVRSGTDRAEILRPQGLR
jgi:hypothetical protein